MRLFRRVAAAAVSATLAVGLAGLASPDVGSDMVTRTQVNRADTDLLPVVSTRRKAVAEPMIEADPGVVYFSPNGDLRRDRAPMRFSSTGARG